MLQVFGPSAVNAYALLESYRQQGEVIKIGSEIEVAEQQWKRCEQAKQPNPLSCLSYRSNNPHIQLSASGVNFKSLCVSRAMQLTNMGPIQGIVHSIQCLCHMQVTICRSQWKTNSCSWRHPPTGIVRPSPCPTNFSLVWPPLHIFLLES